MQVAIELTCIQEDGNSTYRCDAGRIAFRNFCSAADKVFLFCAVFCKFFLAIL